MSEGRFFAELQQRGLVAQVTNPELATRLEREHLTFYTGFDPTAASLHLGNFIPIINMMRLQRAGHRPIAVVGGATGMIGDPSGRNSERSLLSREQVEANCAGIRRQLERFLDFDGPQGARLVNNADWIAPMSFLDWLREVGKHFSVNVMLSKDSVQNRLEGGLSFTEFSYQTLQAYDFLHLYDTYGCTLQAGGSDQWGNITAGTELIRKKRGAEAYGLTYPLLTTASGDKFGKSAGNALWLEAHLTSPYQIYQYFVRTDDRDAHRYLNTFTFLSLEEIAATMAEHAADPGKRLAQRKLAEQATQVLHGAAGLAKARQASEVLFGGSLDGLGAAELRAIFAEVPNRQLPQARLADAGLPLVEALVETGLAASKAEARRAIQQGGVYLNNRKIEEVSRALGLADLLEDTVCVLRSGKKNYALIEVVA